MTLDLFPDGHTVSQETLDRLAELDAAATPGPWEKCGPEEDGAHKESSWAIDAPGVTEDPIVAFGWSQERGADGDICSEINADLIVAMRNALPALLALARMAQANIAAARSDPQSLLDELDAWAEADPEHREVDISFPHETGKGHCVTLTTTEQPDWTEWVERTRQFFAPTLTAAIQAALDAARSTAGGGGVTAPTPEVTYCPTCHASRCICNETFPEWCICDDAYRGRWLRDPACRHDEMEQLTAERDEYKAGLDQAVAMSNDLADEVTRLTAERDAARADAARLAEALVNTEDFESGHPRSGALEALAAHDAEVASHG